MMKIKTSFTTCLLAAAVLFTAAACGTDDDGITLGGGTGQGGQGGNRPSEATCSNADSLAVAARMEAPAVQRGNPLLAHWSVERGDSVMTFCLEYDRAKYHSRWVAFRFDATTRERNVSRKDYSIRPQYPIDPLLPEDCAIESDAPFGSGYDHGHLCASADRLYSRTANDNTFFMTNMSPQLSRFNQNYWVGFESLVQSLGRNKSFSDTLYVVKGGTIADGQTIGTAAQGRMPIPKYYFIALLKVKGGTYSSIAFWVEHKNYGTAAPGNVEMAASTVSVNRLEELTGIDFFPNLPDALEEKVEDLCLPSQWGM